MSWLGRSRKKLSTVFARRAVSCSAVTALAGWVYLGALDNPFVYDDHRVVVENLAIRNGLDLESLVRGALTRPVLNLSYALDYAVWGLAPFGYHLTNVLLHILNVILLFNLAWTSVESGHDESRRVRPASIAVSAALPFAIHPVMTSAVGYVTGRSEVLCAALFLLALEAARRWLLGRGVGWWGLSLALWMAALGTKEIAAMFPVVLLCYERFVLQLTGAARRRAWRSMHIPFFALTLIAAAGRVAVLALMEHPGAIRGQWTYLLVELDVVGRYLTLLLAPQGQTIFHAVPSATLLDPGVHLGIAAVLAILATAWVLRKTHGLASTGLFWFLSLLVPSSLLVVLDQGEPMAEHRVYLASCGFFLAAGTGIEWLLRRMAAASTRRQFVVQAILAAAVLTLCARTVARNAVWSDPIALWREAVDKAPDHWLPHLLLGESLHLVGRRDEAIAEYTLAIRFRPEEASAYQKLALSLVEQKRFDNARVVFENLQRVDPLSAVASNGLGVIALVVGDRDTARKHFQETLTHHPDNVPARQLLAQIAEIEANPTEALRLCREVRELAPQTPDNDDCIRRNEQRLAASPAGSH